MLTIVQMIFCCILFVAGCWMIGGNDYKSGGLLIGCSVVALISVIGMYRIEEHE